MATNDPYKKLAEALPALSSAVKVGMGVASRIAADLIEQHGDKVADALTAFLTEPWGDGQQAATPEPVAHRSMPEESAISVFCQQAKAGHHYYVTDWRGNQPMPGCPFTAGEHTDMAGPEPADAPPPTADRSDSMHGLLVSFSDNHFVRSGRITAVSEPEWSVQCDDCGHRWTRPSREEAERILADNTTRTCRPTLHSIQTITIQTVDQVGEGWRNLPYTDPDGP